MACGNYDHYIYALEQFALRDAFWCTYSVNIGELFLAMVVLGFPLLAIGITTRSIGHVMVVMFIIGGVFLPMTMPIMTVIAAMGVLTLMGIVPTLILRRMER